MYVCGCYMRASATLYLKGPEKERQHKYDINAENRAAI